MPCTRSGTSQLKSNDAMPYVLLQRVRYLVRRASDKVDRHALRSAVSPSAKYSIDCIIPSRRHHVYLPNVAPTTSNSNTFELAMNNWHAYGSAATHTLIFRSRILSDKIVNRTMARACGLIEKDGRMRAYLFTNVELFFSVRFLLSFIIIFY